MSGSAGQLAVTRAARRVSRFYTTSPRTGTSLGGTVALDLPVEGIDVGGLPSPGLVPDLLVEGFGQAFFEMLAAGVKSGRRVRERKKVGVQ